MVISFSSPPARNHLLEKGMVYTFRKNKRKRLGNDWANEGRGKPKMCDVHIEEIGEMSPSQLVPYFQDSGFPSWSKWYDEIQRLNQFNFSVVQKGWLLKVTLRTCSEEATESC